MWCRVVEARREEHVIVAQLWRVEAKEVAAEALSDASLLGLDKQQRVVIERGSGGHDGLFDGLSLLALAGLVDILEVPRRDGENAEVREDL